MGSAHTVHQVRIINKTAAKVTSRPQICFVSFTSPLPLGHPSLVFCLFLNPFLSQQSSALEESQVDPCMTKNVSLSLYALRKRSCDAKENIVVESQKSEWKKGEQCDDV
jgi:hypothetical protein